MISIRALKKLRKEKKWSKIMLSKKTNISYDTICRIETKQREIVTLNTLIKLADIFDVEIDCLVKRKFIQNKEA